ncbi:MAG TPA: hypothetical protein VFC61_03490 [Blastocatellia bacterium]|nr:hypothetical protein [Blastocatellia bacterium]
MAGVLGNIIFLIIAAVVVVVAAGLAFAFLGTLFGLVILLAKLAFIGGLIYLVWLAVRKFAHTA